MAGDDGVVLGVDRGVVVAVVLSSRGNSERARASGRRCLSVLGVKSAQSNAKQILAMCCLIGINFS